LFLGRVWLRRHLGRSNLWLTEIYIEALLVDEELPDRIWKAWDQGEIDDSAAMLAWWFIVQRPLCTQ
jgi:hypothetical protein